MGGHHYRIGVLLKERFPEQSITIQHAGHVETLIRLKHGAIDEMTDEDLEARAIKAHKEALKLGPEECDALTEFLDEEDES